MIRRRRYEISILADKIVEGSRLLRARAFLHVRAASRRFELVAAMLDAFVKFTGRIYREAI